MEEEEGTVRLGVRLPVSTHHKLQEQAREHHRSLNAEIVFMLDVGLRAEQILSKAEHEIHQSEQKLDDHDREIDERLKAQSAQIKELASDFQKIKERAFVVPQETVDLIGVARGVAERRGKTLGDLLDEALRKVVNEAEPE